MKYSRRIIAGVLALVGLGLSGCGVPSGNYNKFMSEVATPRAIANEDATTSTMVFYWSGIWGSGNERAIFDVTDGNQIFIGMMASGKKIAYAAPPGKRTYMVYSTPAEFVEADTRAGKTYYVKIYVRKNHGFFQGIRFAFKPLPASNRKVKGEVADCKWVEPTPESLQWAQSVKMDVALLAREEQVRWREARSGWSERRLRKSRIKPDDGD